MLRTQQQVLRARTRDTLFLLDDPRSSFVVEGVRRDGDFSLVDLLMASGMRAVGVPDKDDELTLGPANPNWGWLGAQRKKLKERLAEPHWTHEKTTPTRVPRIDAPMDPLKAVEALR